MDYELHYYDLVLVGILASLGGGALVGLGTGISLAVAVPLASLAAIVIIVHALFVNGPVDEVADLTDEVEAEEVPVVQSVSETLSWDGP